MEEYYAWLNTVHPEKGSKLEEAVRYSLNQKQQLTAYLEHVLVQLPYLGKNHSHEELEALMPWVPYIQQNFRMKNSNAYENCYLD